MSIVPPEIVNSGLATITDKCKGRFMATTVAVATMKVAQIAKPGAGFQSVEGEIPEPGVGQVRIKVQACGVCHSDVLTVEGLWPGIQYPRVPGHEVAGIIHEGGPRGFWWEKGERGGGGLDRGPDNTGLQGPAGEFSKFRAL